MRPGKRRTQSKAFGGDRSKRAISREPKVDRGRKKEMEVPDGDAGAIFQSLGNRNLPIAGEGVVGEKKRGP